MCSGAGDAGVCVTSFRRTLPAPEQPALFQLEPRDPPARLELADRNIRTPDRAIRDRRDVFNGRLLKRLSLVGPYDIPKIEPCSLVPDRLVAFSEAARMSKPDPQAWVHCYEDDYKAAERFWHAPEKYSEKFRGFAGVICPDHSTYRNLPWAHKIFNTYRNQFLGAHLQADGHKVIPNVRLSGRKSIPFALAGVPVRSTLALGLHGCTKSRENRPQVIEEIRMICDMCVPANLVVYGSGAYGVLDYPLELGIPVHVYDPDSFCRSSYRKTA